MEGRPREVLNAENLAALFGRHLGLVDAGALANGMSACSAPCCVGDPRA
jgi:hypothetical protein